MLLLPWCCQECALNSLQAQVCSLVSIHVAHLSCCMKVALLLPFPLLACMDHSIAVHP